MTREEARQLALDLSDMTDAWEREVESRYDEIMQYVVVLLALEDFDNPRIAYVVEEAFRRAGVPDINLQQRLDLIRRAYPGAQLSTRNAELLQRELTAEMTALQARARQRMTESVLAGADSGAIREAVAAEVERSLGKVTATGADTLGMADRVVLGGLGLPYFLYDGPADAKNRPFCADIVRRRTVFTPRGVQALNNHPDLHKYVPPNVAVLCGGVNCRHLWLPLEEPPEGWEVDNGGRRV